MSGRSRRTALLGMGASWAMCASGATWAAPAFEAELRDVETALGGRLGLAGMRADGSCPIAYRGDELFPLCSTFKALAASLVLTRVDAGLERLDRRVVFARSDLVTYSPVTQTHVGGDGMSLAELCEAAITQSDNTAGNLLLSSFGGPSALTSFVRSLGDPVTRLDRTEPSLNEALPGDPRDTTSPVAMADNLRKLAMGTALSPGSKAQLRDWLLANRTGAARIRSAVPAGWQVGDKTGTGDRGAAGDVAIVQPSPVGAPFTLTVYLSGSDAGLPKLNAAIAEAARIAIRTLDAG